MKYLIVSTISILGLLFSSATFSLEKKSTPEIVINDLVKATQAQIEKSSTDGLALVWWIPYEFWAVSFEKRKTIDDEQKEKLLNTLKSYNLIGVVEGDSTPFGSLNFSSKEKIGESLKVTAVDANGNELKLSSSKIVNKDIQILVQTITPILQSIMGDLGKNFHFYIFDGETSDGFRIMNPYEKGQIKISFHGESNENLETTIETPLNPLFVPRECPNGKHAHVSWKFCHWSGEEL